MVAGADYDLGGGCCRPSATCSPSRPATRRSATAGSPLAMLEAAIGKHAWRLRDVTDPSLDQLRTLLPDDLQADAAPVVDWTGAPGAGLEPPSDPTVGNAPPVAPPVQPGSTHERDPVHHWARERPSWEPRHAGARASPVGAQFGAQTARGCNWVPWR